MATEGDDEYQVLDDEVKDQSRRREDAGQLRVAALHEHGTGFMRVYGAGGSAGCMATGGQLVGKVPTVSLARATSR